MIAVVACGGSGTRMRPVTQFINKHLIPVGDDLLMIDHPLRTVREFGFSQVAIVTGSNHASQICEYVKDGEKYGFEKVKYFFQTKPAGIADIFNRIEKNLDQGVLLVLGDNYFEKKQSFPGDITSAYAYEYDIGCTEKAKRFGQKMLVDGYMDIVEKPAQTDHSNILTGMYYFPSNVVERVKSLTPSARGELEITDLLRSYLKEGKFFTQKVNGKWADLGEINTWMEHIACLKT